MKNIVDELLESEGFNRREFTEKQSIIHRGRPTVVLYWVKKVSLPRLMDFVCG